MAIYEPDIGFVLDPYEEHFYEVLHNKDNISDEQEAQMSLIGAYWMESLNKSVNVKLILDLPPFCRTLLMYLSRRPGISTV